MTRSIKPAFDSPTDIIVWATRVYLHPKSRHEPVPNGLEETFRAANRQYLLEALIRVLDRLVASTLEDLTVHAPHCHVRAFHEQVLITALRYLQKNDTQGYYLTMSALLPPSAVRLAQTDMTIISSGLSDIERTWPHCASTAFTSEVATSATGSWRLH